MLHVALLLQSPRATPLHPTLTPLSPAAPTAEVMIYDKPMGAPEQEMER